MTATQTRTDPVETDEQDEAVKPDRPGWRVVLRGALMGVGFGRPTLVDLTDEGQDAPIEIEYIGAEPQSARPTDVAADRIVGDEKPHWRIVLRGMLMGVGFGGPTLTEIRQAAAESDSLTASGPEVGR
ncbi:MAG: hypothetical protein AAGK32_06710 [Actinomycetota bacterium]